MNKTPYLFHRGLDRSHSPLTSSEDAFLKFNNCYLSRPNTVKKRGGSTYHAPSSGGLCSAGWIGVNDFIHLLVDTDGMGTLVMYRYDGASWTTASIGSKLTDASGNSWWDKIYNTTLLNAFTIPAIQTGNNPHRCGGEKPSSVAGSTGSAGALTGNYYYVITWYDSTSGWESSPSDPSSVVSPSSQKIDLSSIPTTPPRENVSHVNIYRTLYIGEAPYYYVGQVTVGTTTFNDNVADTALGAQPPTSGDHDPPKPGGKFLALHLDRAWTVGQSSDDTELDAFYSLSFQNDPVRLEYFNYLTRVIRFRDEPIAAVSHKDLGLLIFYRPEKGIDVIRGNTDLEFELYKLYGNAGTNYQLSVAKNDEYITWWDSNGPRLMKNGQIVEEFERRIQEEVFNFGTIFNNITSTPQIVCQWFPTIKQFVWVWGQTIDSNPILKVFGYNPYLDSLSEYVYRDLADEDVTFKALIVDRYRTSSYAFNQNRLWFVFEDADGTRQAIQSFDELKIYDGPDLNFVDADIIIGPIDPEFKTSGIPGELQHFGGIEFPYRSPYDHLIGEGILNVYYAHDVVDPLAAGVTWTAFPHTNGETIDEFIENSANFTNIRIFTQTPGATPTDPNQLIILEGFNILSYSVATTDRGNT